MWLKEFFAPGLPAFFSKLWRAYFNPFLLHIKPVCCLFFILAFACNNPAKKKIDQVTIQNTSAIDNSKIITPVIDTAEKKHNQLLYAITDTIAIISNPYDTLRYTKKLFNGIVDHFPELHRDIPLHPDIAYPCSGMSKKFINENGKEQDINLNSEIWQDEFYMLYAYFLAKQNPCVNKGQLKIKLEKGYRIICNIFLSIEGFGTYFTHQYRRIPGYAAYDAYWGKCTGSETVYNINIIKQKKLFLNTFKEELIELVKQEDYFGKEREIKIKELLDDIKQLEPLITDYYILRKMQAYRYSYYR